MLDFDELVVNHFRDRINHNEAVFIGLVMKHYQPSEKAGRLLKLIGGGLFNQWVYDRIVGAYKQCYLDAIEDVMDIIGKTLFNDIGAICGRLRGRITKQHVVEAINREWTHSTIKEMVRNLR